MTNLLATAVITTTLVTNWVTVQQKEVGVVSKHVFAEVVYEGKTNVFPLTVSIVGQPNVRDPQPVFFATNFWIPPTRWTNITNIIDRP